MASFKGIIARIGPNGIIKRYKTVKIPTEKFTHVRFNDAMGLTVLNEGSTVLYIPAKNLVFWRRIE